MIAVADEELDETEDLESQQFNSMLNAAKKHVGITDGDQSSDSHAQDALEALLNDDDDDETSGASGENGGEGASSSGEGEASSDGSEGEGAEAGTDGEGEEASGKKGKKKKKEPKPKKERKPINKVLIKRLIIVATVIIALCVGFLAPLIMFTDFIKTDSEKFAITAANAVNSRLRLNTEFYVYRCYVSKGAAAEECMLYGLTSYGGVEKLDIYRVVVENDDPETINIYYTVDVNSEEFQKQLNSSNAEDRIQAAQRQYHNDETMQRDTLIKEGSEDWEKVDCAVVNRHITSEQIGID